MHFLITFFCIRATVQTLGVAWLGGMAPWFCIIRSEATYVGHLGVERGWAVNRSPFGSELVRWDGGGIAKTDLASPNVSCSCTRNVWWSPLSGRPSTLTPGRDFLATEEANIVVDIGGKGSCLSKGSLLRYIILRDSISSCKILKDPKGSSLSQWWGSSVSLPEITEVVNNSTVWAEVGPECGRLWVIPF